MLGNLHTADIKLLRTFLTIVRCGGFSAAQAKLNTNQSTISTQMSQLEIRLGVRLCERGQGGFWLTPEGEKVVAAAEKVFGVIDYFVDEINACADGLRGELRLGLTDYVVQNPDCQLAQALRNFYLQAPQAHVDICSINIAELEAQVLDGRLHMGVGVFLHHLPHLKYETLCQEENLLYCGEHHPLFASDNKKIKASSLDGSRLLDWGLNLDLPFSYTLIEGSNNVDGIALQLQSSDCISYLPSRYANYFVKQGILRPLLPTLTRILLPLTLVTHPQVKQSKLVIALLECIRTASMK